MTLPDHDPAEESAKPSRRRMWPVLKWLLCILVVAFVGRRAYELWNQDEIQQVQVRWGWLVLAGGVYAVGWLPSVWFWKKLMQSLGGRVRFMDAARAYYCGHLGKYVPGKVVVLVIRAALMKDRGSHPTTAVLTAAYETLLMMGVGVTLAVALSPLLVSESQIEGWPIWIRGMLSTLIASPILTPLLVVGACLLLLPLLSELLTRIAVAMTPREMVETGRKVRIPVKLVALGLAAFVVGWVMHGVSLGLTLRAVSVDALDVAHWPVWTGAVSFASAVGFVMIFAPGGIGIREGLLIEILRLQPGISEKQAVVTAVLLRIVWFVTEIGAATLLYSTRGTNSPGTQKVR